MRLLIKQGQSGLSLVELMVVVVIAGILLSLAFVMMTGSVDNSRLRGATDAFYMDLLHAQNHAVNNSGSVFVNVTTGVNWCYGVDSNTACDCNTNNCALNSEKLNTSSSQYQNITLASSNVENEFVFEPVHGEVSTGITTSPAVFTFTATSSGNATKVSISSSGQVSSCSDSLGEYAAC